MLTQKINTLNYKQNTFNFGQLNANEAKRIILNTDYFQKLGQQVNITQKGFFSIVDAPKLDLNVDGTAVIPRQIKLNCNKLEASKEIEIDGDFFGKAKSNTITIASDSESKGTFSASVVNIWGNLKQGSEVLCDKLSVYWTKLKNLNGVNVKTTQPIEEMHVA